jgi:hypothetical protein
MFKGEDLYVYIDGGAEIYQEYGFTAVAVQDYRNSAGKSVSLEIFEMADDEAGFGVFSFKTTGKGEFLGLGDGGQLEEYYLNFRKGPYVVTITGFDGSPETVRGLMEIGRATDLVLPAGNGRRPALVEALPGSMGFSPESVKFVRGRLGLNNIMPFASGALFAFTAAVRATYGPGDLFIIDCGGRDGAERALASLESVLGSGTFRDFRKTDGLLEAIDEKGRIVRTSSAEGRILITNGPGPGDSEALMDAARAKLRSNPY